MADVVLHPILSVCSGIGGLDLGVRAALGDSARIVCYVERDIPACEVLAARIAEGLLDDAPIWTDLGTFDGRPWRGKVAGIIGGYPCQPFSYAGKQLGASDPRHLWPSIQRIIKEAEPEWCFFENVVGHIRLGYFDVVRPALEDLGYRVVEGIFSADEVGAPHTRKRFFILASQLDSLLFRGDILANADGERRCRRETWRKDAKNAFSTIQDLENADCNDGLFRIPDWPPGPRDTAAWQRVLARYPHLAPAIEPAVCRVVDGFSDQLDISRATRIRLLGNAVVPAQAEHAFRTLCASLQV